MKKIWTSLTFTAALTALLWGAAIVPTRADESAKKPEISAPEAVLTAFHKAYPAAVIGDISKETKGDQTYFEIESVDGKTRRDLLYFPDGKVFEIEEAIAVKDLPNSITKTIKDKYPDGEIHKAEKITRGDIAEYEVLVENGENNLEILLDSKGVIKSQASTSDDDEKTESGESGEADED